MRGASAGWTLLVPKLTTCLSPAATLNLEALVDTLEKDEKTQHWVLVLDKVPVSSRNCHHGLVQRPPAVSQEDGPLVEGPYVDRQPLQKLRHLVDPAQDAPHRILWKVSCVDLHHHLRVYVVLGEDLLRVEKVDVGRLGLFDLPLVRQPEQPVAEVPLRHVPRTTSL